MEEPKRNHARIVAGAWCVLVLSIILAASLAPPRFDVSEEHIRSRWQSWLNSFGVRPVTWHLHRDLITNFLLYLPLGLLTPWLSRRGIILIILALAGPALSLAMEMAQLATTNRYPSVWDLGANSAGYLAAYGFSIWMIGRWNLTPDIFVGGRGGIEKRQWAAALQLAYLPFLVLCFVLPLDLKVGLGDIWLKLHDGRILLNPLGPWGASRAKELGLAFALMIPFGFFGGIGRNKGIWYWAFWGAMTGAFLELIKLPVASRGSDLMGIFAGAGGAGVGALCAGLWDKENDSTNFNETSNAERWRIGLLFCILIYSLFLWLQGWWPLEFVGSLREGVEKLRTGTLWVPFRSYAGERSVSFFFDFVRETAWWAPLGAMAGGWLARVWTRGAWWLQMFMVLAVGGVFAGFVEFGQCLIVGRWVDTTDVFSHGVGLAIGCVVGRVVGTGERGRNGEFSQ